MASLAEGQSAMLLIIIIMKKIILKKNKKADFVLCNLCNPSNSI